MKYQWMWHVLYDVDCPKMKDVKSHKWQMKHEGKYIEPDHLLTIDKSDVAVAKKEIEDFLHEKWEASGMLLAFINWLQYLVMLFAIRFYPSHNDEMIECMLCQKHEMHTKVIDLEKKLMLGSDVEDYLTDYKTLFHVLDAIC